MKAIDIRNIVVAALTIFIDQARAATIKENTYYSGELPSEGFTVNSNQFLALVNTKPVNFAGPLTVNKDASVFIGNENAANGAISSTFSINGDINNYGTIVLDNRNSSDAASVSWTAKTFNNYGSMFFNGASAVVQNSFVLTGQTELVNKGLIQFTQQPTNWDAVGSVSSPSLVNEGTICLKNMKTQTISSISGSGCIVIGENSIYDMLSISHGTVGSQMIYLSSTSSELYAESDAKTDNIVVAGFGNGNVITFRTSIDPFRGKWSYDGKTGILTVKVWPSMTHIFNIGLGYDSSKFDWKQIDNHCTPTLVNNAIYYKGPIPDGANKPDKCLPCVDHIPWIPKIEETTQYEGYDGSQTTTASTKVETKTGNDGSVTEQFTYYVKTPATRLASTQFNLGKGSKTTTVETQLNTFTGKDGKETIETIFIVETPVISTATTKYTLGKGSATTTVNTEYTTDIASDGKETVKAIYFVETPAVYISSTMITNGTNSHTTTINTEIRSFVGVDGKQTIETIYLVETPTKSLLEPTSSEFLFSSSFEKKSSSYPTSSSSTPAAHSSSIAHNSTFTTSASESFSYPILESTYTTHYSSDDWFVEKIVSYYGSTGPDGNIVQATGTAYFRERVDAQPVFEGASSSSFVNHSSSTEQNTISGSGILSSSNPSLSVLPSDGSDSRTSSKINTSSTSSKYKSNYQNLTASESSSDFTTTKTLTTFTTKTTTHCSENKCSIFTTTIEIVDTITTTDCPLSHATTSTTLIDAISSNDFTTYSSFFQPKDSDNLVNSSRYLNDTGFNKPEQGKIDSQSIEQETIANIITTTTTTTTDAISTAIHDYIDRTVTEKVLKTIYEQGTEAEPTNTSSKLSTIVKTEPTSTRTRTTLDNKSGKLVPPASSSRSVTATSSLPVKQSGKISISLSSVITSQVEVEQLPTYRNHSQAETQILEQQSNMGSSVILPYWTLAIFFIFHHII